MRVLTVDDSRAVRSIVRKQITEMGFEAIEAEDGQQGLEKLKEGEIDLVLLDVTMPVMDGPAMLAKMREGGSKIPVIMLTSESKRSIVANAMRLGISDYILKPFKPEELRTKMLKVLDGDELAPAGDGAAAAAAQEAAPAPGTRQFIDVMLVDDMENVSRKLRALLPPHMTMHSFISAQPALNAAKEKMYRVVMIDSDLADVQSSVLGHQLRMLQPHVAVLALPLRSTNDVARELKAEGFDGVFFKPFTQDDMDDFLQRYFDSQDILTAEDNVLRAGPFHGKDERMGHYFEKLHELYAAALVKVASACYDEVILDLSQAPARQEKMPKAVMQFAAEAGSAGLDLRLVVNAETKKILAAFTETRDLPLFASMQEARAGKAA